MGRDYAVGDVVDRRYALRREIDRGGIGSVFEAEHLVTTRTVAIKLLRSEYLGNPEATKRLLREAKALTLARHPNVVTALDAGTTESGPYLAMELIEGRTLAGILTTRQRVDPIDAVLIGVQLCDAMIFAHSRGVVHRDIKPSNLFIARSERGTEITKLFDFGVAALKGDAVTPGEAKITQQGAVVGTPEYMAPEQLLGRAEVDHRADQYAIAATLYECLSGHAPYEGTYGEILLAAQTRRPAALVERCAELAPSVAAIIERALAKDPKDRYPGVRELASALLDAAKPTRGFTALLGIRRDAPPPLPRMAAEPAAAPPPRGRRRYARAPYVTPVRIVRADGSSIDGRSEDVSEGGMLVLSERPCDNGEHVQMRFALPISGRIVSSNAIARWVRMARGTGALGLEFEAPAEDVKREIADYVTAMGGEL